MNVAVMRASREMKKCMDIESFNIQTENVLEWKVKLEPKTEVFRGRYDFTVHLPENYPFSPPKIKFLTTVFHPNIDIKGEVCLGILSEWEAKYTMVTVFNALLSIFQEPNLDNPVNIVAAKLWPNKKSYIEKMREY